MESSRQLHPSLRWGLTLASIPVAFLVEPYLPLGDWRWGLVALLVIAPGLFLHRQDIVHYFVGKKRRIATKPREREESAKFGERQEIICEYRDILYDREAKSDHEKARRDLAGICDAFNIKHPGIQLRYFAIIGIGYEDSWQIFASKLTEFARNENLQGARAILKPPADDK